MKLEFIRLKLLDPTIPKHNLLKSGRSISIDTKAVLGNQGLTVYKQTYNYPRFMPLVRAENQLKPFNASISFVRAEEYMFCLR